MKIPDSLFSSGQSRVRVLEERWLQVPTSTFVGTQFTEAGEEYERKCDLFGEVSQRSGREVLAAALPTLTEESVVMEIGAGTGHATHAFLSLNLPFKQLVLNDIAEPMLRRCDENLRRFGHDGRRIVYLIADSADSGLKDNLFDLIYGFAILHHILDYRTYLKEVHRLLRPGGAFAVVEPMADTHLLTAIILQLCLYVADVRGNPVPKNSKDTIDSFCNNIIARTNHLFSEEELAAMDDKHLFEPAEIVEIGKGIGFREAAVIRQTGLPPGMCERFIGKQLQGLGVEPPPDTEIITKLIDRIMPGLFQHLMAPRSVIRLIK